MTVPAPSEPSGNKHADRRARTLAALMAAAATNISRHGYSGLVLDRVASDAGYTRGALYHLFANKDALVLAVVEWVGLAWRDEVGHLLAETTDPVQTLITVARRSAVYARQEHARALMRLRPEFAGTNHPIEQALQEVTDRSVNVVAELIAAGRTASVIPPGPPAPVVARAYIGVLDGVVSHLGYQEPYDAQFAENAVLGVLGLPPRPAATNA